MKGDALVWILVMRGILEMAAGVLFFREPMLCGGKNRTLHHLIGTLLFFHGLSALNRAYGRVVSVPLAIPVEMLLWTDLVILVLVVVVVFKLGYDTVMFNAYCNKVKDSGSPCKAKCDKHCPYNDNC